MRTTTVLAQATLLLFLGLTTALRTPSDSVLLSKIKTLTLRQNSKTTARRGSPIPQLQCTGGNAKGLYEIDVMRCTNSGSDYDEDDVQWTCKASLPSDFKLGSTDVSCEGYDSPEDPYVLKGSCGVEYRLVLTEAGERKYGHREDPGNQGAASSGEKIIFWLFFAFVAGMIGWGIWDSCVRRNNRRAPHANPGHGGGWGGDDDNGDDPPPPYSPYQPGSKPSSSRNYGSTQGGQQWRPGFWSGAAAGAGLGGAAGYMAGNRSNNTRTGGSRGWGGSSSSSSSSPPAPSSSRYESTGFGSSSRR